MFDTGVSQPLLLKNSTEISESLLNGSGIFLR